MGRQLKGVIIGAGWFAGYHADGWRRIPQAKIVAVADIVADRAREFAARWNIPRAYAGAAELLAAERPDFVDIATRPDSHLELTRLAASHGVHVICQKPMAPTLSECEEMVKVCAAAKVRLIIHENWRWQAWYREVGRLAGANVLGKIFHVGFRMRTGDGRGPDPYGIQPYFREMERFLIYETAIHYLDTSRYFGGELTEIFCRTARINPVIRGEDYALVQFRFAGGAHGLIDANRISGKVPNEVAFGELRLEGDRGMAQVDGSGRVVVTVYGRDPYGWEFDGNAGYKGDSVKAFEEHAVNSLISGRPAESEGSDYLRMVRAVFACYDSAATGRVIQLA